MPRSPSVRFHKLDDDHGGRHRDRAARQVPVSLDDPSVVELVIPGRPRDVGGFPVRRSLPTMQRRRVRGTSGGTSCRARASGSSGRRASGERGGSRSCQETKLRSWRCRSRSHAATRNWAPISPGGTARRASFLVELKQPDPGRRHPTAHGPPRRAPPFWRTTAEGALALLPGDCDGLEVDPRARRRARPASAGNGGRPPAGRPARSDGLSPRDCRAHPAIRDGCNAPRVSSSRGPGTASAAAGRLTETCGVVAG